MTSEIPSLGSGGEHTPATDPHGRGLGQKEKKEEPDHTSEGNSNVLAVVPVLTGFTSPELVIGHVNWRKGWLACIFSSYSPRDL